MNAKRAKRVALYVRTSTDHQTVRNQERELEVVAERHASVLKPPRSIRILLRAGVLAVVVVVAAIVPITVGTVRSGADRSRTHCSSTVAPAIAITRITRDGATGATRYRTTRTTGYGPTGYRM